MYEPFSYRKVVPPSDHTLALFRWQVLDAAGERVVIGPTISQPPKFFGLSKEHHNNATLELGGSYVLEIARIQRDGRTTPSTRHSLDMRLTDMGKRCPESSSDFIVWVLILGIAFKVLPYLALAVAAVLVPAVSVLVFLLIRRKVRGKW